jgi:DNA-binding transcriptional ArsR family regulator
MSNLKMNFFQMPNELWDMDLDVYQRVILTHIIRKTIGWGKQKDGISLSQFASDLKISKPKVVSTLKSLIDMGLIEKKESFLPNGGRSFNSYNVSENIVTLVNDINRGSKCGLQGVVNDINRQNTLEQNTTTTKKTDKQTQLLLDLEANLKRDLSSKEKAYMLDYIKYRKEIKKPIKTYRPLKAHLEQLILAKQQNKNIDALIQLMKDNEWQTVKAEWLRDTNNNSDTSFIM